MLNRDACALARSQAEKQGAAWVIGALLICPCHLPLTLTVAATVLTGTTAGLVLRTHWLAAGVFITLTWLAATFHGVQLMRRQ